MSLVPNGLRRTKCSHRTEPFLTRAWQSNREFPRTVSASSLSLPADPVWRRRTRSLYVEATPDVVGLAKELHHSTYEVSGMSSRA